MKQQQSSRSAEGVAGLRAIEAEKPEGERVCNDPFAKAFTPGGFGWSISKWIIISGLYDKMAPGGVGFVVARERYIDDFLITCLREGLDQVVILGAGFDTRAYRIAGIQKTRVFELDHPATQAEKLKRLQKVIDPLPAHVTFLPVDLNTQTLDTRLLGSGYDEHAKTLFIWQGVTYFLTREGVDSTLAFISAHSGPGSALVFDYFYNEVFNDKTNGYAKALRRAAQVSGEDYMFGIDRGQIEPFLTSRGFRDVQNTTIEDLKQLYFTGKNASRIVPHDVAIASAKVDKTKAQV